MTFRSKLLIQISVLLLTVPFALVAQSINRFNYGEIPFGQSVSDVLETVEGAYVHEHTDPRMLDVFNYRGVFNYFGEGIYESFGRPGYFRSAVVRFYTLRADEWDGEIEKINLYFFGQHDSDDEPVLFMVHKRLENMESRGAYATVVSTVRDSVSSTIGSAPATNVQTDHVSLSLGRTDADMASWETDDVLVLMLTSVNPFASTVIGDFDFVYIHKGLWQAYIEADQGYNKYLEQRDREAASESTDNF